MARQQIKQYVFVPGTAGNGYVQIPGNFSTGAVLAILDTTAQQFIYNFADTTLSGSVSWVNGPNSNFPTSIDGVTTITLNTNTSGLNASDKLAVYVELPYAAQRPFALDAVERMRVANPQSLIDADFEYGLQNTKWQSLFTNNDNPSIYEVPGSDVYANTISYIGFLGNSITSGAVAPGTSNVVIISNGNSLSGPGNNQPNWTQNDFAIILNTDPVGKPTLSTYTTANVASQNQRALSVVSSTGFNVGDNVFLVYANASTTASTTTASLSAGQTALSITGANSIVNGSLIMVGVNSLTTPMELMAVTAGGGSGALTVVRNRWNTNSGNTAITSGQPVIVVGQVELANVTSIDSSTQISVNRGYMNTAPQDNMYANSIVTKAYWDLSGASGTNVEIVQLTTIGSAQGNIAQISRGALGTTPAPQYGVGSPIVRLSGIFLAGNVGVPQVGINLKGHSFIVNGAISTQNHYTPVTEGQYQVSSSYQNYLTYVPKAAAGLPIGYQVNRWDTYIRYAGFYGTASLPQLTFTSDGQNPSTITATSAYAHGLTPGTPILANLVASTGTVYASGPATILSIPTVNTFTFLAKTGAAVTGPITGACYVRPSSFFTHRAADGGVNLGTGTPHHGASASRQTKKYFRYQSGKGLMWTSGTLLGTNLDVTQITASGTGIGNVITITTDQEHQLQVGANIQLGSVNTTGYNGYYIVQSVTSYNTLQCNVTTALGSVSPIFGNQPKLVTVNWAGASVRAGIFDDQNGVFWENTGVSINVVLRAATYYMTGTVSVEVATNLCTGDGTCQFLTQFVAGDKIILRGMTHTVTSVIDNNTLTISPVWRGLTNQTRIKPSKVIEQRYPQNTWNIDRLDGTGPSGYKLDPTKMQMLMIQYTWYGAGFIDFGVRGPAGNYVFAHRIMNNNVNYQAYMRSGNLPARYQAINDTPYQILNSNSTSYLNTGINSTDTTFTVFDATHFPAPSPTQPVYVLVDSEIMKCTGITYGNIVYSPTAGGNVQPATITGVTRSATFNLFQDGTNKSFSAGNATVHSSNVSVRVISATNAPSLNHWGSAVILDGGFDTDRGYAYTYQAANVVFPAGTSATNTTTTAFAMRLAPSVSNQIPGDLGTRDLVNRAQLILQNMTINFSGPNISSGVGARYLVEGILNPNNVSTTSTTWNFLFNSPYNPTVNPSSSIQPSYTQVAQGNITGVTGSSNISFVGSNTNYAWGGERLFAIPVNYTNSGQLDLSMVKQLGNSGIPGFNTYPDGPELLAINITALVPNTPGSVTGEIQVQWNESQA